MLLELLIAPLLPDTENEIAELVTGMENKHSFTQAFGFVDATRIPLLGQRKTHTIIFVIK